MTKYAVIVAGGSGQRMGTEIPKQFLLLSDRPVLCHSIDAFNKAFNDIKIILVLPSQHLKKGEELIKEHHYQNITIVQGGATRFESVKNGLKKVAEPSIVFVHDAVRCMVTPQLIIKCFEQAIEKGSAIPAVAATDSIRIEDGNSHHVIDRNKVRIVQTPQTFKSDILLRAYQQDYTEAFTDEAGVVESIGKQVFLIEGEYDNLKITRPIDIFLAEQILQSRSTSL